MTKEIEERTLTDGSIVFDIVLTEDSGLIPPTILRLHCRDEESANILVKALNDNTVDFEYEIGG